MFRKAGCSKAAKKDSTPSDDKSLPTITDHEKQFLDSLLQLDGIIDEASQQLLAPGGLKNYKGILLAARDRLDLSGSNIAVRTYYVFSEIYREGVLGGQADLRSAETTALRYQILHYASNLAMADVTGWLYRKVGDVMPMRYSQPYIDQVALEYGGQIVPGAAFNLRRISRAMEALEIAPCTEFNDLLEFTPQQRLILQKWIPLSRQHHSFERFNSDQLQACRVLVNANKVCEYNRTHRQHYTFDPRVHRPALQVKVEVPDEPIAGSSGIRSGGSGRRSAERTTSSGKSHKGAVQVKEEVDSDETATEVCEQKNKKKKSRGGNSKKKGK